MQSKAVIVMVCIAVAMLTACGGRRYLPPAQFVERFTTEIDAERVKHYYLSVRIHIAPGQDDDGRSRGVAIKAPRPGDKDEGDTRPTLAEQAQQRFEKMLQSKLTTYMAETKYCRDGHIRKSTFVGQGYAEIKGRCNDTASDADWEKFGAVRNFD